MAQSNIGTQQTEENEVSQRVVAAVAAERDVEPLELPPMYDVIDPDALNKLFDDRFSARGDGLGRVIFTMAGCEVVVHSDGEVAVTAPEKRSQPASSEQVGQQGESDSTRE